MNAASPLKLLHQEATPTTITVADTVLKTLVGKYELVPGFVLTVTKKENQLSAQATGQGVLPIFAKTENIFFYKAVKAEFILNKNDKGSVESVILLQGGGKATGKKLE